MTRIPGRILFLICFTGLTAVATRAQTSPPASKAPATIGGRITKDNGGAPGAHVVLQPNVNDSANRFVVGVEQQPPSLSATTDSEGRYRLNDVPPGSYRISVFAPAYAVDGERYSITPGRSIYIAEGDNVENVDFSMTRGAVITGKVTDENGRPVIAGPVNAYMLNIYGKRMALNSLYSVFLRWETDDRGVYRIFGLEAGRYVVLAGLIPGDPLSPSSGGGGGSRGAFHPDALEEEQAKIVEVESGEEAENIDIKVASPVKGYFVAGRVVQADIDRPIPGVTVNYNEIGQTGSSLGGPRSAVTNALGEFRFQNVPPNSYRAFIVNPDSRGRGVMFGDEIKFDVVAGDVSGLEIRAPREATISGMVAIEGSNDPSLRAKLAQVSLFVRSESRPAMAVGAPGGNGTISPNGTFKLSNVQPGKTSIMMGFEAPKGFALARIEHNGAEVKHFSVNAGDQITGVRLVFIFGAGVIAGRVEVRGGSLPKGSGMQVSCIQVGGSAIGQQLQLVEVDNREQFVIQNLLQGTYKLSLAINPAIARAYNSQRVEQIVTVTGEGRHEVTLILNLTPKEGAK